MNNQNYILNASLSTREMHTLLSVLVRRVADLQNQTEYWHNEADSARDAQAKGGEGLREAIAYAERERLRCAADREETDALSRKIHANLVVDRQGVLLR